MIEIVNKIDDPDDQVTIPLKEYRKLLDADEVLEALEAAGVDNWEGYSHAMEILNGN